MRCWTRQKLNFFSGTPTTEFLIEDKERFAYYHLTCPPRSLDEFEADELEKSVDRMKGAEVKAVFKPWKVNSGGVLHCVSYEVADVSKELHEVFRLENKALASSSVATYQHNVDLTNAHNSVLESKEVVKVREELMRVEKEAMQKQLEEEQQMEREAEKQREEMGLNILGEKAKRKKEKEEKEKEKETDVENEREKEAERKLLEDRIKRLLYKEVGRRVVLDGLQSYVWREGEGGVEWLGELRERVREFVEGNQRSTMKEASFFHSFCNLKNKIRSKKVNEEREAKRKAEADKRKEQGIENEKEKEAEAEEEDGLIFLPPINIIKAYPLMDREDNLFSLNVDLTAPASEAIFSFDDFND